MKKNRTGIFAVILKFFSALIKSSKFIKLALFGASFASYAFLWTWKFSLLMLLAIGWHEYSHVLAMKKVGIKTSGFYFIPLIGGAAIQKELANNHRDAAFIAIAGPAGGAILSIILFAFYLITRQPIFAAACSFNAFINIFNLVPIQPLDGAKVIRSVAFSFNAVVGYLFIAVSFAITIFFLVKFKIWFFLLLVVMGGIETFVIVLMHKRDNWLPIKMSAKEIALTLLTYFALGAFLFFLIFYLGHIPGADIVSNFMKQ